MRTSPGRALPTLLLIPAFLLAACGDPFRTAGELDENPQVLAIAAEPPDIAPGDEVELRALVHWPDALPTLLWMVCIPNVGDTISTCLANAFAQGGGEPPLCADAPEARFCVASIGSTMRYRVPLDAFPDDGEQHTFFVNLLATSSFDGLESCGAVLAGGSPTEECLVAIKRVVVRTEDRHNINPTIAHMSLGGATLGLGDVSLDSAAVGKDLDDYKVSIGVQVDASSIDEMFPPDEEPESVNLVASWFSDCGTIEPEKVFVPCKPDDDAGEPVCALVESDWKPEVSGTCQVHVVVRDGKGGTGWLSKTFEVQ